jgi:23S rRNA pseudouridine1911/1915/1917 synthase
MVVRCLSPFSTGCQRRDYERLCTSREQRGLCLVGRWHGILETVAEQPLAAAFEVAKTKPESGEELFRVLPRQVDKTISAALREWLPGKPWSEVRRLLKSRRVAINGNLCMDAGRRLRLTDVVKVLAHSAALPPDEIDIRVVYLDKHVVVVEKPAGMTTTRHSEERDMSPRRRQIQPTLDELLPPVIAKIERGGKGKKRGHNEKERTNRKGMRQVRAVHRLDRETSGLLVFARTAEAQENLEHQFRKHTTHRRYLAVARGAVQSQTIESRLVRDRGDGRRGSTTLPDVGQRAVTHVRAIERLGDYTLVECRLETGRTHQIRIHLAEQGHPLCGDKVYGQPLFQPGQPDTSGAPRVALCAVELGFVHPISGEPMQFETPPARDFAEFVRRLRKRAQATSKEDK